VSPTDDEYKVQAKREELERLLDDVIQVQIPGNQEPAPMQPVQPIQPTNQTINVQAPNVNVAGRDFFDLGSQRPRMGRDNPNAVICPDCNQITGRNSRECRGSVNCGYPIKDYFDRMDQEISDLDTQRSIRFIGAIIALLSLYILPDDLTKGSGTVTLSLMASSLLAYRGYEKHQKWKEAKSTRAKFIPSGQIG